MSIKPLIVDWKGLKKLGWPYSRTHTMRLMAETITVTEKVLGEKRRVAKVIPNPDPFPPCFKLGPFPNSHPVWLFEKIIAWLKAHGLSVTED